MSSTSTPRRQSVQILWTLIFFFNFFTGQTLRIGEALNPGPPVDFDSTSFDLGTAAVDFGSTSFALGTANVAGLRHRAPEVLSLPCGIWGLTETHLTDSGIKSFTKEAKFLARSQARQLRINAGAPAPPRNLTSEAGTWTGVLCLSDHPTRITTIPWHGEVQ